MSRQQEQVEVVIRKAVQAIIARGLADPRITGMITVTKVQVSPDRRAARVFCSVLPEDRTSPSMHGLKAASGWIGRQLGEQVSMRRVPTLEFVLDESLKKQARVLGAIQDAAEREGRTPTEEDLES
ncbi:MAG: 30S ribosome-binding factor RbfA [Phycisphaerales bacterium]|nr:30S ribosome-binding factor RbfA [Phycisphaerales bacterium]